MPDKTQERAVESKVRHNTNMTKSDQPTPEAPQSVRSYFGEQLDYIRSDVITLAGLTGEAIRSATQCVVETDISNAASIVAGHSRIDELKETTELKIYEILATQQPMAGDLRVLITVLRILQEIQLSADLAVSVAKTTRRLFPGKLSPQFRRIVGQMGKQAVTQLEVVMDAFSDKNVETASALPDMNDVMDDLQKDLFRQIFSEPIVGDADPEQNLQFAIQLALLGRFYERIADHTVLIGVWTRFMVTGEFPSRTR